MIVYVTNKAHLSLNYFIYFLLLEVALFNTQWLCDVSLKISPGINLKNIIRTGLNGFTAEQLLCAVKYKFHCFENMVERKYEPVEVRSDDDSDGKTIYNGVQI